MTLWRVGKKYLLNGAFVDEEADVAPCRRWLVARGLLVAATQDDARRAPAALCAVVQMGGVMQRVAAFVAVDFPTELPVDVVIRATQEGKQGRTIRAMLRGRKVWSILRLAEDAETSAVVGVPDHCRVVKLAVASYLGDSTREMQVEAVDTRTGRPVEGITPLLPWSQYGSLFALATRRGAEPQRKPQRKPSLSMSFIPGQKPAMHSAETVAVAADGATWFKVSFRQRKGPSKSAGVAIFKVFGFRDSARQPTRTGRRAAVTELAPRATAATGGGKA
jgi:hypothetical protein